METIQLLSEEMVIKQRNNGHKIDNLKNLEVDMKLRGFSKRTTKTYLYYNSKFLEYINKSPEEIAEQGEMIIW